MMKIKKGLLGSWYLYDQLNRDNHVYGRTKWGRSAVIAVDVVLVLILFTMVLWAR